MNMSDKEPGQEEREMNTEREAAHEHEGGLVANDKNVPSAQQRHDIEPGLAHQKYLDVEHAQGQEHGAEWTRQPQSSNGACSFDGKRLGGRDIRLSKVIR